MLNVGLVAVPCRDHRHQWQHASVPNTAPEPRPAQCAPPDQLIPRAGLMVMVWWCLQEKEHMKAWFSKDINPTLYWLSVLYTQLCSFCAERVTCQLMNFNRLGSSANWQIRIENWLPQFSHYAGEKLNLKWLMLFIFKLKSKTLLTDLPKISGWNYFNLHPWQIWLN